MKILRLIILLILYSLSFSQEKSVTANGDTILLFDDGTYRKIEANQEIDSQLLDKIRSIAKKHKAGKAAINEAYSLAKQGWSYTLPQPKSNQAAWGNSDGRTTWWYGYWHNSKTGKYSQEKPKKSKSGIWIGDGQKMQGYYRRGGSPRYPNKVELILSDL